ncbi:MAG: zf-HC2 domain-containing protein [Candidatus Brocadiia bacterium]
MKCKRARQLIPPFLEDHLRDEEKSALERHFEECPNCAQILGRYRLVREGLENLSTPQLPEEVKKACGQALDELAGQTNDSEEPPANPDPVRGARKQVVWVLAFLLAVAAFFMVIVSVVGRYSEPPVITGTIVEQTGDLYVRFGGQGQWTPAPPALELTSDTILRTSQNGMAKIQTNSGHWILDSNSVVLLPELNKVEIAGGRILAVPDEAHKEPLEINSENRSVFCPRGAVTVRVSHIRLRATCLRGKAQIRGQNDQKVELEGGQQGMALGKRILQQVRPSNARLAGLWTRRLQAPGKKNISQNAIPLLPAGPSAQAIPQHICIREIKLNANIRGPLLLISAQARLENIGDKVWDGQLPVRNLFWPQPIAATSPGSVRLEPGEKQVVGIGAIAAMATCGEELFFAIVPGAWGSSVSNVSVKLRAPGENLRSLSELTRTGNLSLKKAENREYETLKAAVPLVYRAQLKKQPSHNTIFLTPSGSSSRMALVAVHLDMDADETIRRSSRFLLGLNASGDYKFGGTGYPHEICEEITARLDRNARLLVAAYDGKVKILDPTMRGPRHIVNEKMLAGLWQVGSGVGPPTGDLPGWIRGMEHDRRALAIVVTDHRPPQEPLVQKNSTNNIRTYLLQIGAHHVLPSYGKICASTGGAALALQSGLPADGAVFYLLKNLTWPGYKKLDIRVEQSEAQTKLLTRPGEPSCSPVLAIIRGDRDLKNFNLRLVAARETDRKTYETKIAWPEGKTSGVPEAIAANLAESLRDSFGDTQ